jgi:signal transduction histidine kinase
VRRFLPRSLLGQMMVLMAAALLVAQLVNFAFILSEQQKLSLAQNEGPAITRFAQATARIAAAPPEARPILAADRPGPGASYRLSPDSLIDREGLERSPAVEKHLAYSLAEAGVRVRAIRGMSAAASGHGGHGPHQLHGSPLLVLLSAQLPDGSWLNGRFTVQRTDPWLIHRMLLATIILYLLVLGSVLWIAVRLARPLRALTHAAERFEGRSGAEPVEPRGPSDISGAIEAFNAMNRRTLALLDEKDRMLGAIGHDLRTPLASLRIRAENMGPDGERAKLIATVEEMAATLEDILVLARTGRAREPERPVDLAALADALVEEYRALGRKVIFEPSPRAVRDVQPNLLRRALRNLIDNGVAYGGGAKVRVVGSEAAIELIVDDDGPGMDEEQLREALEPFNRLETSRNRESGGSGLGLAIARAVAQAHGGDVVLARRPEGGLSARIILPKAHEEAAGPD